MPVARILIESGSHAISGKQRRLGRNIKSIQLGALDGGKHHRETESSEGDRKYKGERLSNTTLPKLVKSYIRS